MIEKSNELLDKHEIDKNDTKRIEPNEQNENNTIKKKSLFKYLVYHVKMEIIQRAYIDVNFVTNQCIYLVAP